MPKRSKPKSPPPAAEQAAAGPQVPAPKTVGPFELLEKLGQGGTSTVYKARHQDTGAVRALKIGADFLAWEPMTLERFKREFTIVRELRHPHLVETLDFGEVDDVPYLVLEFVAGRNLEQLLKQNGPLPVGDALTIFHQVSDGLRYLHQHQIVHRDIKPGNILVDEEGRAKLGDFGLLKNLAGDAVLTRSGQAMGTMEYGAPEQFEDAKSADFRCDLYSLAAALYTALTGQFPFGVGSYLKILQRKLQSQFVPLAQLVTAAPAALNELVTRSLHPQREQRPDNIDEFMAALQDANDALAQDPNPAGAKPNLPPGQTAGGPERRATVRIASTLAAAFVPFHQQKRGAWNATILDVSSGGLRLQTTQPYPVDTVLEVLPGSRRTAYLVQVRWVKVTAEQAYILGCAFTRPVPDVEIEEMFPSGQPKTETP